MQIYKNFLFSIENNIALFQINRPDVRNALNLECWQEISQFIDDINSNDDVRVAIITGFGEKAFAAGADINMLKERSFVDALSGSAQSTLTKLENSQKPIIAAVNGYAFGGGCELALACDIRVVSHNAIFGLPELSLGILPGAGGTQRLAKLVGLGRAKDVILAGRTFSGEEAVNIGLAYKAVPQEELINAANDIAKNILAKGPLALRLTKQIINASMSTDTNAGQLLELLGYSLLVGSEDKREGIDAFFEKRKPNFNGR